MIQFDDASDYLPWGAQLRRWRTEIRCWSQQELAEHVVRLAFETKEHRGTQLDARLVARWERGDVKRPQAVYRRLLSRLGAPVPPHAAVANAANARVMPAEYPQLSPDAVQTVRDDDGPEPLPPDGDDVQRRQFLKLGSLVAASAALPTLPVEFSPESGGTLTVDLVANLRNRLVRLRKMDDLLGGADTYSLYAAEANNVLELLKQRSGSTRVQQALLELYSEQTQQAGWAAFDAGWNDTAAALYKRSHAASIEIGDNGTAGNALALRSYQLTALGRPAIETTRKSLYLADQPDVHPRVRALLYDRAALTFALTGDAQAVDAALGKVEDALAEAPDNEPPDYAAWIDDLELLVVQGRCWSELRRPLRSVPALEAALPQFSDQYARDKALYSSWLADSYIDAGEAEKAAEVISRSLDLIQHTASVRPQKRLIEVGQRLTPHRSLDAVSDMFARDAFHPLNVTS